MKVHDLPTDRKIDSKNPVKDLGVAKNSKSCKAACTPELIADDRRRKEIEIRGEDRGEEQEDRR